ncbi:Phosphoglucomutase/phosphomannomutase subunit alpha/beta [Nitrosotalea devaniterrae]|uniref:Phosphoglucomutase/phosphomannomutase subunit alpha/beta n=1 Tax=Nitrosotalea devaniterrae TaxID=1078905 RepID=A0A128A564_9ARCH|nr:Phosphoglucomutase/phosphomannomutase subunit alpha/beta [Candidatus Nitrosotalea devanaterra]
MKVSISGVRGIFGNDLNLEDIIHYCRNFSRLVKSKKCVVGRDTRPSGEIVTNVAIASLLERGISVYNLGISPTPVVFREARKYGSGLIITSSHNPLEWNGLKFILDGRGINESELQYLEKKDKFQREKVGTESQVGSDYIDEAAKVIGNMKKSSKIAIDVGGGAAFEVAPQLLRKLGCKVNVINGIPGKSTRGPDPTNDQLSKLVEASKKTSIGFAFDLDGDRLVVVKNGKKQSPDVTLGLGVAGALEKGYKKFVLSIDTSVSIEKFIKNEGGQVSRSKVGEANVVDLMLKTKSQAGGEGSSAGFILPEFNMCRDGLLTSGLIASMVGTKQFDDINKFMEEYHQVRTKVSVDSKLHKKTLQILLKKMKKQSSQIITIDGIKSIIDDDSWVLVRQSNTEHIIRVSVESNDLSKAKSIEKQVTKLVKQSYEESK